MKFQILCTVEVTDQAELAEYRGTRSLPDVIAEDLGFTDIGGIEITEISVEEVEAPVGQTC